MKRQRKLSEWFSQQGASKKTYAEDPILEAVSDLEAELSTDQGCSDSSENECYSQSDSEVEQSADTNMTENDSAAEQLVTVAAASVECQFFY